MRIVLGVGGGIAAYKACEVASRLTQEGHRVHVVMTETARRFVAPLTFEALTHQPVGTFVADEPVGPLSHVRLAREAEALVVAPLTADLMSRMAEGRADDLLTAVYLGVRCPVIAAPAMETEMWTHPATVRNAERLRADGVMFIGPEEGRLASGATGAGRMADPDRIVAAVRRLGVPQDLRGLRILVTAGPTWEFFDPVRLLSNPSSGAMGVALAEAARDRGATVTLVHGPLRVPLPEGITAKAIVSALELERVVGEAFDEQDVVISAAAVADFRPARPAAEKMKKRDSPSLLWEVVPNPDILAGLGRRKQPHQILVGFAAETSEHVRRALEKMQAKRVDLMVANRVEAGRGFGPGPSEAWLVWPDGRVEPVAGDKTVVANRILDAVRDLHAERAAG